MFFSAGNITLYEARGQQIYVKEMQIDGIGQRYFKARAEQRAAEEKGYFESGA